MEALVPMCMKACADHLNQCNVDNINRGLGSRHIGAEGNRKRPSQTLCDGVLRERVDALTLTIAACIDTVMYR